MSEEITKAKVYNGKYFQQGLTFLSGKGEPVPHGIRAAAVKCSTDSFTAAELIPKDSTIMVGKIPTGALPAFAIIKSSETIGGTIGIKDNPILYGAFVIQAGLSITLPVESVEPLRLGGDVFIKLAADFAKGGKINVRLFFT